MSAPTRNRTENLVIKRQLGPGTPCSDLPGNGVETPPNSRQNSHDISHDTPAQLRQLADAWSDEGWWIVEAEVALRSAADKVEELEAALDDFAHAAQTVLTGPSYVGTTQLQIEAARHQLASYAGRYARAKAAP